MTNKKKRDMPVFDTAENARIGPGSALAFVRQGGDGSWNAKPSSADQMEYLGLKGDWSYRPYRKELEDDFGQPRPYRGGRPSPARKCAPAVWALLDTQAKLAYEPEYT